VLNLDGLLAELSANRPVLFDEEKMLYILGRIAMKRLPRTIETAERHTDVVLQGIQERAMARA
jgi:hypothetical protein